MQFDGCQVLATWTMQARSAVRFGGGCRPSPRRRPQRTSPAESAMSPPPRPPTEPRCRRGRPPRKRVATASGTPSTMAALRLLLGIERGIAAGPQTSSRASKREPVGQLRATILSKIAVCTCRRMREASSSGASPLPGPRQPLLGEGEPTRGPFHNSLGGNRRPVAKTVLDARVPRHATR